MTGEALANKGEKGLLIVCQKGQRKLLCHRCCRPPPSAKPKHQSQMYCLLSNGGKEQFDPKYWADKTKENIPGRRKNLEAQLCFLPSLKEFLPLGFMKVKNVEKKIFVDHKALMGTSEIDSKYKYVKLARGLPTFGVHFFLVKVSPPFCFTFV